jgi:hypothetical protein
MLMLALFTAVVGAALGLRFKVVALLPAFIVASLAICAVSILLRSGFVSAIAATASVVIGLQIGYLFGAVLGRAVVRYLTSHRIASWPPRQITGVQR